MAYFLSDLELEHLFIIRSIRPFSAVERNTYQNHKHASYSIKKKSARFEPQLISPLISSLKPEK